MKYFLVIIFVFLSLLLKAQITENVNIEEIDINFSRVEEFDIVSWKKGSDFTKQENAPRLPVIVESFVVPFNGSVLSVTSNLKEKIQLRGNYLISPTPPSIPINGNVATSFYMDSSIYDSSFPYPKDKVKIISDEYEHGYHVVTVEICPFEYIPKDRSLFLLNFSFTINYEISNANFEYSIHQSSKQAILAYDYIQSKVKNSVDISPFSNKRTRMVAIESNDLNETMLYSTNADNNSLGNIIPEYLIITSQDLKQTFQYLADWKTKKGVPAIITTIEEINLSHKGSDLEEKIRNYLKECRRNWGTDFFVLLGGDCNVIPARIATNGVDRTDRYFDKEDKYVKDSTMTPQDLYYTALDGDWNMNSNNIYNEYYQYQMPNKYPSAKINIDKADYGRDIYLGRAPVQNNIEAMIFVEKILIYEKAKSDIDYSYILNSLSADAFIDKDDTGFLSGDARREINSFYDKYPNLHRWLIFDHYNCSCSKHTNYLTQYPGEELTKNSFLSALQNGGSSGLNHFHLVYHMDHSSARAMGTSSLDKNESICNEDVDHLNNGNYLQIIMSSGCSPATFTDDCVAEHFLNTPNGGAVAFIGNADRGWSNEYDQFGRMLSALYSSTSYHYNLGYIFQKSIGNRNSNNCRLTLLGDPEMPVWTAIPQKLDVSVTPDLINNGENVISIQINNLPVNQKAFVCLMKNKEGYARLSIEDRNSHTFAFTPKTSGVVDITITAQNFAPFETTIPVSVSSNAVLHISNLVYDDDKQGESNGNGDKQLDAGEVIELAVTLKNDGGVASNEIVTGQLACNIPEIEFIKSTATFDKINMASNQTSNTKFVFAIDKDCKAYFKNSLDPIEFTLTILDGGNSMIEKFQVDIYAPEIQIGNQKVTWTTNGNTTVEPGETVKMNIDLTSLCKSEVTGLKAVLVSNNAQVSCSSTPVAYPDIPTFETKTNAIAFQFQTSSAYVGPLNFTLNVSNEYGKKWSFPMNPLLRPTTINVSTISSQPYNSSINVYWTPVTGVAGYHIYRSNNGENGTYQRLNKFLLTAAYYLDESLSECTAYHYKVAVVSTNGNESGWSTAYRTWTSYPAVSPFPLRLTTGTYQTESCPNVADVDNDGKQEIFGICGDRYAFTSYLVGFRPTGEELYNIDNNVTTVSGFAKMMTLSGGQVAFGDLYCKGEQNIVISSWNNDQREKNGVSCYSAFDRNGDQRPDLLWETKIPYSSHQSPVVANLDGSIDGSMEVIVKSHQNSDIYILDNNGNELRRLNPKTYGYNDSNYSNLTVADLDDDGQMEIIASYDVLGIYIWRHDGTPFTENPFWGAGITHLASAPVVCDLNEDGKKELIFSQNNIAISHIYAISLDGDKAVAGWNGEQAIPYTDNDAALDHTLSVGDINNDGHLEVVILGHGVMKVWKHTGELLFSKEIQGLCPSIAYAGNSNTSILADVDGDAVPDIVFCSGRHIYAVHSDGSDIIGFPITVDEDFQDTPCVADIDGDGKNELIASNSYDLYVWKTNGLPSSIEWGTRRGNPQNTGEYFPTVCEPMIIVGDKIWDGESPCGNVVVQSGKLVIPAGKTMTLGASSALIIRAGGTLEVDGGIIREANIKAQDGSSIVIKNNGCIKLKKNAGFQMEKGAQLDYRLGKIDLAD